MHIQAKHRKDQIKTEEGYSIWKEETKWRRTTTKDDGQWTALEKPYWLCQQPAELTKNCECLGAFEATLFKLNKSDTNP